MSDATVNPSNQGGISEREQNNTIIFVQNSGSPSKKPFKEMMVASELGFQVVFLGLQNHEDAPNNPPIPDMKMEVVRIPTFGRTWLIPVVWFIWIFVAAFRLRRHSPEIIHSYDLVAGIAAYFGSKKASRFIFEALDPFWVRYDVKMIRPIIKAVEDFLCRKADVLVTVDHNRLYLVPEDLRPSCKVIYNTPPDLYKASLNVRESTIGLDGTKIYVNGWLKRARGFMEILSLDMPSTEFVIAGYLAGEEREFLEGLLQQGRKNISYVGELSYYDALKKYREVDLVFSICDPRIEINRCASSNKMFDCMMMGVPILINSEQYHSQTVRGHEIGWDLPYAEVRNSSKFLQEVLQNSEELVRRGGNARQLYENEYNWTKQSQVVAEIYGGVS